MKNYCGAADPNIFKVVRRLQAYLARKQHRRRDLSLDFYQKNLCEVYKFIPKKKYAKIKHLQETDSSDASNATEVEYSSDEEGGDP